MLRKEMQKPAGSLASAKADGNTNALSQDHLRKH